ncbi:zinc finger protein 595-like [Plodia interpunctella]|uniref:zinc finger protein 595-like n=1 Tax=Plodia interpunctella TaxID=58824 RepID=UPI0023682ACD|nr:zinc finger protein 595-like [Plodia interpunctella]
MGPEPEDIEPVACRGCLVSNVKLYCIEERRLVENYAQFVGISLQDHYTQYLCAICATQLWKFSSFKERCRKAYQFIMDIEFNGANLTPSWESDLQNYSKELKLKFVQTETQTCDLGKEEDCVDCDVKLEVIDSHQPEINDNDSIDDDDTVIFIIESDHNYVKQEWDDNENVEVVEEFLNDTDFEDSDVSFERIDIKNEFCYTDDEQDICLDNKYVEIENKDTSLESKLVKRKKKSKNNYKVTPEEIAKYAASLNFTATFLTEEEQRKEIAQRKLLKNNRCVQCELCYKNCTSEQRLSKHKQVSHNENLTSVCRICYFRYRTNTELKKHMRMHAVVFKCNGCSYTTKFKDALHSHNQSHKGKKYICDHCKCEFDKATSYFSHVRLQHSSELPWCDLCGESFLSAYGIRSHKKKMHRDLSAELSCEECDAKFCSDTALGKHVELKICDQQCCAQCGQGFPTEQSFRYHLIHYHGATQPQLVCQECNVVFPNMPALKRHQEVCGLFSFVPCVQCGASFEGEAAMLDHVKEKHSEQSEGPDFKCVECDKEFTSAYYYRCHIAQRHLRPSRVQPGGSKRPRQKRIYKPKKKDTSKKKQRTVYAGHRTEPYVRIWRPSVTGGVEVLNERGRVYHNPAVLKAVCEICGKGYRCEAVLREHKLSQHSGLKPHRCEVCAKGFVNKDYLMKHMILHTDERDFQCEYCPKAFKTRSGLVRHHLMHTGVRLHCCHICNKHFATSTSVKLHIKGVHMKIPAPRRIRHRGKKKGESEDVKILFDD